MEEYIIINKTAIQKRIEELEYKLSNEKESEEPLEYLLGEFQGQIKCLKQILSQSTPLIPEIEKAFTKGERYGWDSQKSIGNIDEMKEKIKLQSLDNYISNLKLDI